MQSVFEKIIERLEERTSFLSDCTKYGNKDAEQQKNSYSTMMMYEVADLVDDLIEIVKQAAEDYNNGWIPTSERLPDSSCDVIITTCSLVNGVGSYFGENQRWVQWYSGGGIAVDVIAWQPLPPEYQPKGE